VHADALRAEPVPRGYRCQRRVQAERVVPGVAVRMVTQQDAVVWASAPHAHRRVNVVMKAGGGGRHKQRGGSGSVTTSRVRGGVTRWAQLPSP
jgi:hypothetical protein